MTEGLRSLLNVNGRYVIIVIAMGNKNREGTVYKLFELTTSDESRSRTSQ